MFSIVPVHILIILAGLLCSNHVTYRFGKGMMPKAYRLSMNSMAVIMDNYATCVTSLGVLLLSCRRLLTKTSFRFVYCSQLAEQYGNDVASEILAKSRSGWQLDGLPSMTYSQSLSKTPSMQLASKYDSIASKGE